MLVHSQANRDSRPHLIGGHGDYGFGRETGKFGNRPETNSRRGSSRRLCGRGALHVQAARSYAYVTHNLIEAVELGATAHFKVEGKWNDDLMTQVKAPQPIDQKAEAPSKPRAAAMAKH